MKTLIAIMAALSLVGGLGVFAAAQTILQQIYAALLLLLFVLCVIASAILGRAQKKGPAVQAKARVSGPARTMASSDPDIAAHLAARRRREVE